MILFFATWFLFASLALGPPLFIFLYMKKKSSAMWPTKVDFNYKPRISIIIPTYNEANIINFKLDNLARLAYPKDLYEVIVVDSNSTDKTVEKTKDFAGTHSTLSFKIIVEKERKGKSHALNNALSQCSSEIVIVSDADCFWPSDILERSIPYLADSSVGAIGGPKILFNSKQSWITRMEETYLKSANYLRLGESKAGSTVFFEGGFFAFKRQALERFDPYFTGSDDSGSIISLIEKNYRAMLVKEAQFYSSFPSTLKGKISIKLRRINQLIRVFSKYIDLFLKGRIKSAKSIVIPNALLYLVSPVAFFIFSVLTVYLLSYYPALSLCFLFLLIPQVRFYSYQIVENNLLLFVSLFGIILGQKFCVWSQPEDRIWLTAESLTSLNLI